jgi:hypothetical protein
MNKQERAKKRCMPFYYCPRSCDSKVVSTRRSKAKGKEVKREATRG